MLSIQPLLTASIVAAAAAFAFAVVLLALAHLSSFAGLRRGYGTSLGFSVVVLSTAFLMGWPVAGVPVLGIGLVAIVATRRLLPDFTREGRLLIVTYCLLVLSTIGWGAGFLSTIAASALTQSLLVAALATWLLTVPATLIGRFEEWEGISRGVWRQPRHPLTARTRDRYPKVSVHIPTYAEPPDLVIATLDAIARIHYPNFEVLVVDNNTKDSKLWRPVEAHCRRLGFRFFHVDPLSGAKAGAVNFALAHTAIDAELIAVMDADYQTEPDFLERLVGFFDDPAVGFVQTPHDYRDWQGSLYQRMCYWEYAYGVKNLLVSLNEHGAAYTIGTMCIIRRQVLDDVGGWAEWCLTEDSELAVRIHALGYSGYYIPTTFGRGLIPETFLDYKNQRFRWACGPVQQVTHHLRLLLPPRIGKQPSLLTGAQRLHELSHGLGLLNVGIGLLVTCLGLLALASMVLRQEVVVLPVPVLWTLGISLVASGALKLLAYRVVLGCSLVDTLGAMLAKSALSYTVATAGLAGILGRPTLWRRTNKFPRLPLGLAAMNGVRVELVLGLGGLVVGLGSMAAIPAFGLSTLLAAGLVLQGATYLTAPVLALLADRDLRARRRVMVTVRDELPRFPDGTQQI